MKAFAILCFGIILGCGYFVDVIYSEAETTSAFTNPIISVIKRKANLPKATLRGTCAHLPNKYQEILDTCMDVKNILQPLSYNIRSKLPDSGSTEGLINLINEDCINFGRLKYRAGKIVFNLQMCLADYDKLDFKKEKKLKKDIVKSSCEFVNNEVRFQLANTSLWDDWQC